MGELAEGVLGARAAAAARQRGVDGTYSEMVSRYGGSAVVDPRSLCLPAGGDLPNRRRLRWVAVERVRTGEEVWLPLDFVANEPAELEEYSGQALITPITNGLGAGLDPDRALRHGLLELLQRHLNGLRFRALDRLSPEIDPATLPTEVTALLQPFRDAGVEVVLKHAGTDFGVHSVYAMGIDERTEAPIMVTAAGEGADPDPVVAVRKAVLEYANSRSRKAFCFGARAPSRRLGPSAYWDGLGHASGEPRAVEGMQAWAELGTPALRRLTAPVRDRTVSFQDLAAADGVDLLDLLAGLDVLALREEVDGVHVAKVVVPGLEVETLSYGRIGAAGVRTALQNDLDLVRVAPDARGGHDARVMMPADVEEEFGGPVWFSWTAARATVGQLYPLYREPPRHLVAVD